VRRGSEGIRESRDFREPRVKSHSELIKEFDAERKTYQQQLEILFGVLIVLILILIVIYIV
jgi:hypothetical protein